MVLLAELGDVSRFDRSAELMSYVSLVPSIHASGGITRTGNRMARTALIECAWACRFPARRTAHMRRKAEQASDYAAKISWKAQKRLCGRYQTLIKAGKSTRQTTVAVARELLGFIWDVASHEMHLMQSKGV